MRSQWACDVWVEGEKQVTFSIVESIIRLEESEFDGSKKRLIFEHNGNNGKFKGNAKVYVDSAKLFIDAANS